LDAVNRLSMFVAGVSGSNTLRVNLRRGGGTPTTTAAAGSLLLNGRIKRLNLRGTLAYTIDPEAQFTNASFTADYRFKRGSTARVTLNQGLTGDLPTTVSVGLFHIIKNVALGANASFSDDGRFAAGLTLTFSTGREPRKGSFERRPRGMARSGAASALVFLDRNLDGSFDEGDRPLEGVRFRRRRDVATDEDGVAFLTGLSAYQPTDVVLDLGSLEDPYWVPTRKGVEIVPRPGKTALLDFAVVPTGEIDGIAYLRRGEVVTEVSNVALQLLDQGGKVVAEVKSAFDGFFLFEFVTPGRYRVRVSPEQVARLRLVAPPGQEVVIGVADDEGDIVSGLEFVLERAPVEGGD
ncbi:MAG: carboxypeptidase-like regulatory domain-containing protein, partial [Alphaproteobacteria bacterium]